MTLLLTKWYSDCVTADGDVFVGYWARLSWRGFAIPYAASLVKRDHDKPVEHRVIRACPAPVVHGATLEWTCGKLGIQGRWNTSQPPYHEVLLNDPDGSITWRCHVPGAVAHVRLADASLDGLGYAEELTLSLPPSRLPFDVLKWGRFVSDSDALVWIMWQGSTPRQWVIYNGVAVSGATIDETGVRLAGDRGVLELRDAVPLREGPLASTALRAIPGARRWLLRGIEHAHETKWLSAATLTTATHASSGWAIHEVIRLKPR